MITRTVMGEARRVRTLVAARTLAEDREVPLRTIDLAEAATAPAGSDAVVDRIERAIMVLDAYRGTSSASDRLRRVRDRLVDVVHRDQTMFTTQEQVPEILGGTDSVFTAEAVIAVDGTRPSLLVRDDTVDPGQPGCDPWCDEIDGAGPVLTKRLRAVGRIEPEFPTPRSYFGTGWLVDAQHGWVLTNRHVVRQMWRVLRHRMDAEPDGFRVSGGAFMDFRAEADRSERNRFRVVQARCPDSDGTGLARLDIALLRIEPEPGAVMPEPIPVLAADVPVADSDDTSHCVVGYPAAPVLAHLPGGDLDWRQILDVIFADRYGVKRLGPGVVHRPVGSVQGDTRQWVFGHDASTLGGSSGSPVIDWKRPGAPAVGVHFAGLVLDLNVAHAFARCADELTALGVTVTAS